jgi:serine/threonine protein kinase
MNALNEISIEKALKSLEVSSDLSNKSFLISPQSQKVLRMTTFDIKGIYEHITRKHRREKLRSLIRTEALLKKGRYLVTKLIGKGSFGSVIEAYDTINNTKVAIKIIKLKPGVTINTNNEIVNLKKINSLDFDSTYIVKMLDYFEEEGYLCIALELLHKTLYRFLLEIKGMSLQDTAVYGYQLFKALQFLQNQNIIHCDLKPENIMFRTHDKKFIKIVDFGSSCEVGNNIYKFVQSRFYRSPEVTLRLDYGLPIDIWSAGCILAELYTGKPLFESRSETSQMV